MRLRYLLLLLPLPLVASAANIPDAQTIIRLSAAASQRDWQADPGYSCSERVKQDDKPVDSYRLLMIEGSPYAKLTEINGEPISAQQRAEEEEKLRKAIRERHAESPQQRQQRLANFNRQRTRDRFMLEQLTRAFTFKLEGLQKLNGFDVYVLDATPRPGYRPPNVETQALTGMQGRLWIDQKTYQWVKVEARVVHPVSIDGFLARVEPGTRFELEKKPVADGIWLPTHFLMQSRAKILNLFQRRRQEDDTYFDYAKAQ